MFDIGWSELLVIGVVALIAIGPKELPGVLRMVGQWLGKARRMAGEFQGHFQEAMREAEMADVKKQFDDITQTASNIASGNVLTSAAAEVEDALKLGSPAAVTPTTPEPPTAETHKEEIVHEATTATPPDPAAALPQPATYQPVDKAS
jgi:sec-independent protein translocase protein TatB